MKNLLNRQISIKSILIIALVAALSIASIGAVAQQIQAILSPDVSVTFNGARQTLRDVNGNIVHPIVYNGTTYLPVRATADLAGLYVDWDADTRTVLLSDTAPDARKRLTDVGTPAYGVTKTTYISDFPEYDFGLQLTGFNFVYTVNSKMPLTGRFTELTFSVGMVQQVDDPHRFDPLHLRLFNADTEVMLWEGHCQPGEIIEDVVVDITGVTTLQWTFNGGAMQGQQLGYILEPYVR